MKEDKKWQPEDEIDLMAFFKRVPAGIVWIIKKLRQRLALFLLLLIAGTGAALYIRHRTVTLYTTEALYVSKTLPYSYCREMLGRLDQALRNSRQEAASMLSVPEKDIRPLHAIELLPALPPQFLSIWDSSAQPLQIRISISDTSGNGIGTIERTIPQYLGRSAYAQQKARERKRRLADTDAALAYSLLQTDSLLRTLIKVPASIWKDSAGPASLMQLTHLYRLQRNEILRAGESEEDILLQIPFSRTSLSPTENPDKRFVKIFMGVLALSFGMILLLPEKKT